MYLCLRCFVYMNGVVVDVLDNIVRHCNFNPHGKTKKKTNKGKLVEYEGGKMWEVDKDYQALKDFCPTVINEKTQKDMFANLERVRHVKPPHSRTALGTQKLSYEKELMGFEEPMRKMILRCREFALKGIGETKEENADNGTLSVVDATTVVELKDADIKQVDGQGPATIGKTTTFHAFHQAAIFTQGALEETLAHREKELKAVHVYLPDDFGKDEDSTISEEKLLTMLKGFTDTTRKTGMTVKVQF